MKKIITSVLFAISVLFVSAQTNTDDYYNANPAKAKLLSADRVTASISAGAGVSFLGSSKNTAYTTFIAPKIGYKINQRFTVTAGLIHYTTTGNHSFYGREGCFPANRNISGNLVMVGGEYLLNKKIIVSGAYMAYVNSGASKQNNFKAISLGLDYKVSEHSSIGIRATVSQGNPDYMFNPNRNSFDYNPMNNRASNVFGGFGQWGVDAMNGSIR